MNTVVKGLDFLQCCSDDLVKFSADEKQHAEHPSVVLERIANAGLMLKKKKCEFGIDKMDFLSFRIENGMCGKVGFRR